MVVTGRTERVPSSVSQSWCACQGQLHYWTGVFVVTMLRIKIMADFWGSIRYGIIVADIYSYHCQDAFRVTDGSRTERVMLCKLCLCIYIICTNMIHRKIQLKSSLKSSLKISIKLIWYPTQSCILGNSHGLKVTIHSLWFDNPLMYVAASR